MDHPPPLGWCSWPRLALLTSPPATRRPSSIPTMDFNDPAWLSLVVAILVAVGSVVGFMVNRGASKQAEINAARALTASLERASSQSDMAESLRQLSGRTTTLESVLDQYLPKRAAAWDLRYLRGDSYELLNVGAASGYEVRVTSPNAVRLDVDAPDPVPELKQGESVTVFAVGSMQTGTPTIRVEWRATPVSLDTESWSRPVPPKR